MKTHSRLKPQKKIDLSLWGSSENHPLYLQYQHSYCTIFPFFTQQKLDNYCCIPASASIQVGERNGSLHKTSLNEIAGCSFEFSLLITSYYGIVHMIIYVIALPTGSHILQAFHIISFQRYQGAKFVKGPYTKNFTYLGERGVCQKVTLVHKPIQ